MKPEIATALSIANDYRLHNDGELPLLVIAHKENEKFQNETVIYKGNFRPKHSAVDQQRFCSVLRMAFNIHNVKSYEVILKPQINYVAAKMTKNLIAIVSVTETESVAEFFEYDDNNIIPYIADMPADGLFTYLMPDESEKEITYSDSIKKTVNSFLEYCTYIPKVIEFDLDFLNEIG